MIKIGEKEAYDVNEMSNIFHLSKKVVRRYCAQGHIQAQKLGKSWYATKENLQLFLETGMKKNGTSQA